MCPEVYIVLPEVWPRDELMSNQSSILERAFTLSRPVLGCTESFFYWSPIGLFPGQNPTIPSRLLQICWILRNMRLVAYVFLYHGALINGGENVFTAVIFLQCAPRLS